jgi:galactose mutarotase-like enzyme
MPDSTTISHASTSARISRRGAELIGLRHKGTDHLWNGDPAWWNFCAPILFPVIGRSPDDTVRIGHDTYPMPPHGFARDREFRMLGSTADSVTFELGDDPQTRSMFPFGFRLQMRAVVRDARFEMAATIKNMNADPMPFCFGYHPAFLWPQDRDVRGSYVCRFEAEELPYIRRPDLSTGLIKSAKFPSPLRDRELSPTDALFDEGALLFDTLASRSIWFGRRGSSGIAVRFPDSPHLGIWTKPGAPFLCIEPWQGLAELDGGDGELSRRPGVKVLAPGQIATYRLIVEFDAPET